METIASRADPPYPGNREGTQGPKSGSDVKVIHGLDAVTLPLAQSVLTIGNFDGVHRAHQQLLAQAGLFAANTGGPVVVLTFEPHPLAVISPSSVPPRLQTPQEKLRCLAEAGANITVVARSEAALLDLEPARFIEEVVRQQFSPTHIVEGPSFGFGRQRQGDADMLVRLAATFGTEVHIVEPVTVQLAERETLMVSSSLIRRLVSQGKVHRAALCLGRPYALLGEVAGGEHRGHALGFPTANLAVSEQLIPGDGVYVGRVTIKGQVYPSAISIGRAPTFGGTQRKIEAHLLDFEGDLYGQSIRVEFDRFLRPQRTFDSAEALKRQISLDVASARCEAGTSYGDPSAGQEGRS